MNSFSNDLLFHIFTFLDNESIYRVRSINTSYNSLFDINYVYEYFLYRSHPMTFNLLDNYCTTCNIGIIVLNMDQDHLIINTCSHVN